MQEGEIRPTVEEVHTWLRTCVAHVLNIEYYLARLQIGSEDPERPHDIVGTGNKFEWPAIIGFSMQYRGESTKPLLVASLDFHRTQYHHRMFNQPCAEATEDSMKLGAVDAVCSLLEKREYQGGKHSWENIREVIQKNPVHKQAWLTLVLPAMREIPQPVISVTSLKEFANPGIPVYLFDVVRLRVYDAVATLAAERGYNPREFLV